MRKYERPVMIFEEFSTNQVIATCSEKSVEFTCFRGPQNDTHNVLVQGTCSRGAVYVSGINKASSSYKQKTFYGAQGLAYLCTRTNGSRDYTDGWDVTNGVLTHKKNKGSDTHDKNYHCMVAGVTDASNVATS